MRWVGAAEVEAAEVEVAEVEVAEVAQLPRERLLYLLEIRP